MRGTIENRGEFSKQIKLPHVIVACLDYVGLVFRLLNLLNNNNRGERLLGSVKDTGSGDSLYASVGMHSICIRIRVIDPLSLLFRDHNSLELFKLSYRHICD